MNSPEKTGKSSASVSTNGMINKHRGAKSLFKLILFFDWSVEDLIYKTTSFSDRGTDRLLLLLGIGCKTLHFSVLLTLCFERNLSVKLYVGLIQSTRFIYLPQF